MDKTENEEHDAYVRGLDTTTLLAARKDLMARKVSNRRDPEERWIMERRAAIARELDHRWNKANYEQKAALLDLEH